MKLIDKISGIILKRRWNSQKSSYISNYLLLMVLCLLMPSCSDTLSEPNIDDSDKTERNNALVTFTIPLDNENIGFFTRADNELKKTNDPEAAFSDIYLVYTKLSDNEGNAVNDFHIEALTGTEISITTHSRIYSKTFTPGTYRFFVVANLDRYLGDDGVTVASAISSIDDLKNLILTFNTTKTIVVGNLPMACLDTDMKRNGITQANGTIVITDDTNNEITAPMHFLCSKVRYTILFDASEGGISQAFGSKIINFNVSNNELPYAKNYGAEVEVGNMQNVTTDYIYNPDFNNNSDFWNVEVDTRLGFENGYAEVWNSKYNIYQTSSSAEVGIYKLEAQAFYRQGYAKDDNYPNDGYAAHNTSLEKFKAALYISSGNKESINPLMSLYDIVFPAGYFINDNLMFNYPHGMTSAAEAFQKEAYKSNSVSFFLSEKGPLQYGLKNQDKIEGDWSFFDNFKMSYYPVTKIPLESDATQTISLGQYDWDPIRQKDYPNSAADKLNEFSGDSEEWYALPTKAWQGVAYFPENNETDKTKKTVLNFPYCYGKESVARGTKSLVLFDQADNDSDYTAGLQSGMMYDVVIKVVNSQKETDDLIIYIAVNDWTYKPSEKEL